MVDEKILDKIRKVAALTTSSNQGEAANAAAMLTALLLKHNLDISQIPTEAKATDNFTRYDTNSTTSQALPSWKINLAWAISRANLTRVVLTNEHHTLAWMGRESKVEVAEFIWFTTCADL